METFLVRVCDILDYTTTITPKNEFRYKEIMNAYAECGPDTKIIIDFDRINLVSPEENSDFLDILSDDRVTIKLYSDDELYSTLKMLAILSNIPEDHIEFVVETCYVPPVEEEPVVDRVYTMVDSTFKIEDGVGVIDLESRVSIINSMKYVDNIKNVVLAHGEEVKRFRLDISNMNVGDAQIEQLSVVIAELGAEGLEFNVITDDAETNEIMETWLRLGKNKVNSITDRFALLDANIEEGTVGMLTTYAKGGDKDTFGRRGGGTPLKNLPAIYLRHDSEFAYFRVYRERTFFRNLEYEVDNPDEYHPGLISEEQKISMTELGLCSLFVGERYHFGLPIHASNENKRRFYSISEDGIITSRKVSLAEYIREVLDEHGVEYNKKELENCVRLCQGLKLEEE